MPDLPPHTSVKTYSSDFETDENPVSEGGIWVNGLKEGIDWADCVVSNGRIHGGPTRMNQAEKRAEQATLGAGTDDADAAPEGDYDDPTAVIRGEWGSNQYGKGIVVADNPTDEWFQEVEIRLRTVIEPNWCRGYEIFFRCLTDDARLRGDRPLERQDQGLDVAAEAHRPPATASRPATSSRRPPSATC